MAGVAKLIRTVLSEGEAFRLLKSFEFANLKNVACTINLVSWSMIIARHL